MVPFDMLDMVSYYCAIVTWSLKEVRFLRYSTLMSWPWNLSQRSLKVIGTDTDRSATCDFLLTLHSNHRPISHRFRDRWRFQAKIAIFSHPVYLTPPLKGYHLELGIGARLKKLEWWGYQMVKKFKDYFSRNTILPFDRQPAICWQQIPRLSIASRVSMN